MLVPRARLLDYCFKLKRAHAHHLPTALYLMRCSEAG